MKVEDLPLQLTVMCEVRIRRRGNGELMSDGVDGLVLCPKEELQKRIVEEQQNNNLSMEILNGNAESVTGLVGNAQALKEPGTNQLSTPRPLVYVPSGRSRSPLKLCVLFQTPSEPRAREDLSRRIQSVLDLHSHLAA